MSHEDTGYRAPAKLLRRYGLQAKKTWGQCFLHEPRVAQRIVEAIAGSPDETVVEIGAGLGALTGLLARRYRRVLAIERDRELVAVLREELADEPTVEIIEANALTFDYAALSTPVHVVGNLPYNISSPLLFHLLAQRANLRSITVMLQRELAQRLAAGPGGRLYGAPTVTISRVATVREVLQVRRGAFLPPPKVDSTVLRLTPRDDVGDGLTDAHFERVVRTAFGARRKMLRGVLAGTFTRGTSDAALAAAGIAGERRAETLTLADFQRLAAALEERAAEGAAVIDEPAEP